MHHIYISYATEDKTYGDHFKRLLKPLASDYEFTFWSMQDTSPGLRWQQEMASRLNEASLFVPLISAEYLASDRCQAETTAAFQLQQQRGLSIVGIGVRPVYLVSSPLSRVPYLPAPEQPIANWRKRDQAWLQVQRGILDALIRSTL